MLFAIPLHDSVLPFAITVGMAMPRDNAMLMTLKETLWASALCHTRHKKRVPSHIAKKGAGMNWITWLDLAGVMIFALTGVVVACRSRMDPFGMLVLGAVTGIGGGTLRDLVLGIGPVFWVEQPIYLWVILLTVLVATLGFHYIHRLTRIFLPVTDAFGLALFTVIGAHKARMMGMDGIVAVVMGTMSGVAGGMIRDVLARRVPMVLRQEIYASASLAGGILYIALLELGLPLRWATGAAIMAVLMIRLPAIYWNLTLPTFAWVIVPPPEASAGEEGKAHRSADKEHDQGDSEFSTTLGGAVGISKIEASMQLDLPPESLVLPRRTPKARVRMLRPGERRRGGS